MAAAVRCGCWRWWWGRKPSSPRPSSPDPSQPPHREKREKSKSLVGCAVRTITVPGAHSAPYKDSFALSSDKPLPLLPGREWRGSGEEGRGDEGLGRTGRLKPS